MEEVKKQEIEFVKAKYTYRMFAFGADLLCMTILAIVLVILTQLIVTNVSGYKAIVSRLDTVQEKSHLYIDNSGEWVSLPSYYDTPETDEEYNSTNAIFDSALTAFYSDSFFFDQEDSESGMYFYNTQRIPSGKEYSNLFVYDEGHNIVPSATASLKDLYTFYSKAITQDAVAYMMQNDDYMNASRDVTLIFVFVELLIPIVLSVTIFEFIIPVFDKHGKRTIGKRLFKIGVVDSRGLSPKLGRFTCRFLIFLFVEVILSIPALLIPFVISFSMFAFSKPSQSMHDYFCSTYVVDISQNYICKDEIDYQKKHSLKEEFTGTADGLKLE